MVGQFSCNKDIESQNPLGVREGFENGDIAGGSGDKAVKRSFENIRSGDIPAKKNAQIPGRLWGADVWPGRFGPVGLEVKGLGRNDVGFVCVDT